MLQASRLSKPERIQLRQFEDVLATARRWAVEEAKALHSIRERRLYRLTHDTFEQYGQQRWGFEHSQLYRLCQWAEVIQTVSPIGDIPLRETHARPLYGLPAEQQRTIWRQVQRRLGGSRTATAIEAVVADALQKRTAARRPSAAIGGTPTGKIVCGDAIERVGDLRDGTVDLVLFSPPYTEQRKQYPGIPEAEYPTWIVRLMEGLKPKMTATGNVMIVAREHLRDGQISDVWLRTRLAVRAAGWCECETLFWHALDRPPLGRADRPRRTIEYIFWFSRTPKPFVDLRACGNPMNESRARLTRPREKELHGKQAFSRFRQFDVARVTDVVTAGVGTNAVGIKHPAQYPLALADQLVRTYSPIGGLVVDPTAGSGTTLVAARDAGRRWFGIDIVPEYVDAARRRLTTP